MYKITLLTAFIASLSAAAHAQGAPLWHQCGGINYTGPTVCAEGVCLYFNPFDDEFDDYDHSDHNPLIKYFGFPDEGDDALLRIGAEKGVGEGNRIRSQLAGGY
ncbi:hypothetical protein M407DRAFT_11766 [Tulasnella calospora MUT 4182]|uniref:CBM1 domain-containing protein n=1 Tax=Tulasnella calospora MUT 4182 TaxID=1051891 RepID=A0A0C3Q620_9AGAM|nr:hypothetical protein M407DRAFT_11766 [Tulasnella calospora MUT 4182]